MKELLEVSPIESIPEFLLDEDTLTIRTDVLSGVHHGTNIQLEHKSFHHGIISSKHLSLQVNTQISEMFCSKGQCLKFGLGLPVELLCTCLMEPTSP
jgi:hypothetical protein